MDLEQLGFFVYMSEQEEQEKEQEAERQQPQTNNYYNRSEEQK